MKYLIMASTLALALGFSAGGLADKPAWAGEGGRPTADEKQQHKEQMTSKHEYKKNGEIESVEKKKQKKTVKQKEKQNNDEQDRDQDRDRDRDRDRERDREQEG